MRSLALDVGDKRIGVAVSDPTGILATPLTTIGCSGRSSDVREVLRLAAQHDAGEIIVGMPVSLSGRMHGQAELVAEFTNLLAASTTIPVKSVDERFSTIQATRLLRESGAKQREDKGRVDAAAAAVILQSHLDSKRGSSS